MTTLVRRLLDRRAARPLGWRLSSSALSTATAVLALHRAQNRRSTGRSFRS